jgi:hypothetical protein
MAAETALPAPLPQHIVAVYGLCCEGALVKARTECGIEGVRAIRSGGPFMDKSGVSFVGSLFMTGCPKCLLRLRSTG